MGALCKRPNFLWISEVFLWITLGEIAILNQKLLDSCGKVAVFLGKPVDNLRGNSEILTSVVDNCGFSGDNSADVVCKTHSILWKTRVNPCPNLWITCG